MLGLFFDKSSSYSLFMLSIQYVYERVFLFLAPELSFSKRVQNYNFFLIRQAFFEKIFFYFSKAFR